MIDTIFHYKNGFFFEKTSLGNVRLRIMSSAEPDAVLIYQEIIDHDSWLSIIAHCSKAGDRFE